MAKELSMTPDAIRKREKRAAESAAQEMQQLNQEIEQVTKPAQPEFSVLKVGHAFIKGKGTAKPKKDSIWGIMLCGDVLVKFFGRRGSAMRFQQEPMSFLDAALDLYTHKLAGTDAKKLKHVDLDEAEQKQLLGEDWPQPLFEKYKAALAESKVDVRQLAPAQAQQQTEEVPAWPWPTAAMFQPA